MPLMRVQRLGIDSHSMFYAEVIIYYPVFYPLCLVQK